MNIHCPHCGPVYERTGSIPCPICKKYFEQTGGLSMRCAVCEEKAEIERDSSFKKTYRVYREVVYR